MSKRITTRWYIVAWVVWLIAFISLGLVLRSAGGSSSPPTAAVIPYAVMAIAGIVMLVMWIGALVKLGTQRAWGWFAAVLVLHLVALGIIGMVAYAIWGPPDTSEVAMRPTTT
jgi:hypothetical protein